MGEPLAWKIFYGDGTTFDSTMGGPWDAPTRDVMVIVEPDDEIGRSMLERHDRYWFRTDLNGGKGRWMAGNQAGIDDQWEHFPREVVASLHGRLVERTTWVEIRARAKADPDFGPKSAARKDEIGEGPEAVTGGG